MKQGRGKGKGVNMQQQRPLPSGLGRTWGGTQRAGLRELSANLPPAKHAAAAHESPLVTPLPHRHHDREPSRSDGRSPSARRTSPTALHFEVSPASHGDTFSALSTSHSPLQPPDLFGGRAAAPSTARLDDSRDHYANLLELMESLRQENTALRSAAEGSTAAEEAAASAAVHIRMLEARREELEHELTQRDAVLERLRAEAVSAPLLEDAERRAHMAEEALAHERQRCDELEAEVGALSAARGELSEMIPDLKGQAMDSADEYDKAVQMAAQLQQYAEELRGAVEQRDELLRKLQLDARDAIDVTKSRAASRVMFFCARAERTRMEAEDTLGVARLDAERRKRTDAEYRSHVQGLLQLKDEQLGLARADLGAKEDQLRQHRNVMKDMMRNAQESMSETEGLRRQLAAIEGTQRERVQSRRDAQRGAADLAAQVKEAEMKWGAEKTRYEEQLRKRLAKLQTVEQQHRKLEEKVVELKAQAKKGQDRSEELAQAIDRAYLRICVEAAPPDTVPERVASGQLNVRQKIQHIVERAGRNAEAASNLRSMLNVTQQELGEAQSKLSQSEERAVWLHSELDEERQRSERRLAEAREAREAMRVLEAERREIDQQVAQMREELSGAQEEAGVMRRRTSEAEEQLESQRERLTGQVDTLRQGTDDQSERLRTTQVTLREREAEICALRQRVRELHQTTEAKGEEALRGRNEAEAARERLTRAQEEARAALEVKTKLQKAATSRQEELKKVRGEAAAQRERLEGLQSAVERLRKQLQVRDSQLRAAAEKSTNAQQQLDRERKEWERREGQLREEGKSSAREAERLRGVVQAGEEERRALGDALRREEGMEGVEDTVLEEDEGEVVDLASRLRVSAALRRVNSQLKTKLKGVSAERERLQRERRETEARLAEAEARLLAGGELRGEEAERLRSELEDARVANERAQSVLLESLREERERRAFVERELKALQEEHRAVAEAKDRERRTLHSAREHAQLASRRARGPAEVETFKRQELNRRSHEEGYAQRRRKPGVASSGTASLSPEFRHPTTPVPPPLARDSPRPTTAPSSSPLLSIAEVSPQRQWREEFGSVAVVTASI
eukprot:Hpha_TRINITY_DN15424_c4_g9::TRINITY_DN15424_c4_g9_i1::g.173185::m.173185